MNKDRHIVIVGFMGCGKTTVAGALAQRLGRVTIDLDSFITDREDRSPAEIIEQDGEPAFRAIETLAFQNVLEKNTAGVIALGGGAWTIQANRTLAEKHDCLSVWLDAPLELCWERITAGSGAVRPLAPDRNTAKELYDDRLQSYELSDLRVVVSSDSAPELLTNEILRRAV
jgi:shikimate kinase